MVTKYEKANRGKILTAILAMVMVFAGAAIVLGDGVDAADYKAILNTDEAVEVDSITVAENGTYKVGSNMIVTKSLTIMAGGVLVIDNKMIGGVANIYTLTVAEGATISIEGSEDKEAIIALNGGVLVLEKGVILEMNDYTKIAMNSAGSLETDVGSQHCGIILENGAEMYIGENADVQSYVFADNESPYASTVQEENTSSDGKHKSYSGLALTNASGPMTISVDQRTIEVDGQDNEYANVNFLAIEGTITAGTIATDCDMGSMCGYIVVKETDSFTVGNTAVFQLKNGGLTVEGDMEIQGLLSTNSSYGKLDNGTINMNDSSMGGPSSSITVDVKDNVYTVSYSTNDANAYTIWVLNGEVITDGIEDVENGTGKIIDGKFSGTVTAEDVLEVYVAFQKETSKGSLTVTGELIAPENKMIYGGKISATSYTVKETTTGPTTTIYTSFVNAMASVDSSKSNTVTVYGDVEVDADIAVPSKITVELYDGSNLVISKDSTMTIDNGGYLKATNATGYNVKVLGTLKTEKTSGVGITADTGKIFSYDAKYTDAERFTIYTNLANAIQNATDKMKITTNGIYDGSKYVITVDSDLVIDKELKLSINNLAVAKNKTLTIGPDAEITSTSTELKDGSKVIVNGKFVTNAAETSKIIGVLVNSTCPYTYMGIDAAIEAGQNSLTINGKLTIGDITLDKNTTLTVPTGAELRAGTITVKSGSVVNNGIMNADSVVLSDKMYVEASGTDAKMTTVISDGNGNSVTVKDANNFSVTGKKTVETGSDGTQTESFILVIDVYEASTTGTEHVVAAFVGTLEATTGQVEVAEGSMKAVESKDVSVSIGPNATLFVSENTTISNITIDGKIVIDETATLTINGTVILNGTISGESATVSVDTTGNLYMGGNDNFVAPTIGSNASVDVKSISANGLIYVYNGSTINADDLTDLKKLEINMDSSIVMVVYSNTESKVVTVPTLKSEAGKVTKILDKDGNPITNANEIKVSAEKITLVVDKAVNVLVINTAPGVGSIMIDGISIENFSTQKNDDGVIGYLISSGNHTISVYLKAGYEGTPAITVNGQKISGESFTVTNGDNTMTIDGITAVSGSTGGNSGMGLVEILLIVLVVMVVILAIVVILRMMRS